MNKHVIYFLFAGIITLISSCKPEPLETTVDPINARLVINSLITPDTNLWISVTKSNVSLSGIQPSNLFSITKFMNAIAINDALITLSGNGRTDTLRLHSMGLYKLDLFSPVPGKIYTLVVYRISTGETAFAQAILPVKSRIKSSRVDILKNSKPGKIELSLAFEDNPDSKDFYIASYFATNMGNWKHNPETLLRLLLKDRVAFDLVDDKEQKNNELKLKKEFPGECASDTLTCMVSPIEEGYYRFLQQHQLSGGLLSQLAGEVVRYQSNVTGGYGYFSLRMPDMVRIPPGEFNLVK